MPAPPTPTQSVDNLYLYNLDGLTSMTGLEDLTTVRVGRGSWGS